MVWSKAKIYLNCWAHECTGRLGMEICSGCSSKKRTVLATSSESRMFPAIPAMAVLRSSTAARSLPEMQKVNKVETVFVWKANQIKIEKITCQPSCSWSSWCQLSWAAPCWHELRCLPPISFIFIGPRSDHSLPLSVTHSLTNLLNRPCWRMNELT